MVTSTSTTSWCTLLAPAISPTIAAFELDILGDDDAVIDIALHILDAGSVVGHFSAIFLIPAESVDRRGDRKRSSYPVGA